MLLSSAALAEERVDPIEEANIRYADQVVIREASADKGWGVFALKPFEANELVIRGTALSTSSLQDKFSVQVNWNQHALMDLPARFINHICFEANLGVRSNKVGAYDFYALRRIDEDEELLWDYETTEYEIHGFACRCGTKSCRQSLKGFRFHGDEILDVYGDNFVAPYLTKK